MYISSTIENRFKAILGSLVGAGICIGIALTPFDSAQAAEPARTAQVPIHDLNLSSDAGRRTLEARIERAAREVCENGGIGVREKSEQARCIAAAQNEARGAVMAGLPASSS